MKKITKATFKSFIKKNEDNLYIQNCSSFDGMSDCVEFTPSKDRKWIRGSDLKANDFENYNLGYRGIWLVGSSGNYFKSYEDEIFIGIELYNCCGSCIVAIKKESMEKAA